MLRRRCHTTASPGSGFVTLEPKARGGLIPLLHYRVVRDSNALIYFDWLMLLCTLFMKRHTRIRTL